MAPTENSLLTLIDSVYASIERPEQWPETIAAIGMLVGGRPDFWNADWSASNPEPRPSVSEAGCHGSFLLSRADLRALDDYAQEFGEMIGRFIKIIFLSTLASPSNIGARETIGLRMTKRYLETFLADSQSSPPRSAARNFIAALWEDGRMFSSDGLQSMRHLTPHLDRALRLQMLLNAVNLRADMISGALDHLTLGIILVDRSGVPFWSNRRAKEIMDRSDALRPSSTGLIGRTPTHSRSVRELITAAVFDDTQGILAIDREDGLRALLLIASPLKATGSATALNSNESAGGVVFICDPDRNDEPTVESLRRAFDLTHREAQMAIAVARGHGLGAAAEAMGVALTTARTQLQQAFAKTGTSHQAEHAALIQRTLTHLRHD